MILDLIALNENSRVWLYQANRELNDQELELAREQLYDFLDQWTAHSSKLYCYGNIFHRRFSSRQLLVPFPFNSDRLSYQSNGSSFTSITTLILRLTPASFVINPRSSSFNNI